MGPAERELASGEVRTPALGRGEVVGKLTQSSGVMRQEDSRRTEELGEANPRGSRKWRVDAFAHGAKNTRDWGRA